MEDIVQDPKALDSSVPYILLIYNLYQFQTHGSKILAQIISRFLALISGVYRVSFRIIHRYCRIGPSSYKRL